LPNKYTLCLFLSSLSFVSFFVFSFVSFSPTSQTKKITSKMRLMIGTNQVLKSYAYLTQECNSQHSDQTSQYYIQHQSSLIVLFLSSKSVSLRQIECLEITRQAIVKYNRNIYIYTYLRHKYGDFTFYTIWEIRLIDKTYKAIDVEIHSSVHQPFMSLYISAILNEAAET
jgi:hypothetical protein